MKATDPASVVWREDGGGETAVGAKLVSELPVGDIPNSFRIVYESQPCKPGSAKGKLQFILEVKAKKHAGASMAGGTRHHEFPLVGAP